VVTLQRQIAMIAAPTGRESARAECVADEWKRQGVDPVIDAAGNVIAELPGTSLVPPLAILSHLDTVFPAAVTPRIEERSGRLIGPGIGDNARGLAVLCRLPTMLRDAGFRLQMPLELVATVGEEGLGDLLGARHYLRNRHPLPSHVIALDSPGHERVVHRGLGARRYRITASGPGGHSWNAYGTRSALSTMLSLAQRIELLAQPAAHVHRGDGAAVTIATIHGGTAINAIPAEASVEVDVRALDERTLDRLELQLDAMIRSANLEHATVRVTHQRIGMRPAGLTAATDPLVDAAVLATTAVGGTPQLAIGSTDANAAMALGIPAIAIGAGGRGGDAHTDREWFDPTDGALGVQRLLMIIGTLAA
jgi:tripeptide aminopeptidase